jgi:hypothetical protein
MAYSKADYILYLFYDGLTVREISAIMGLNRHWVTSVIRFNAR